jgi:TPR repeat protein
MMSRQLKMMMKSSGLIVILSPNRHGWGCTPDPGKAVHYLTAAASNAASVEQLAIQAGLKKGGAAKGELVLAIFELANCFRHGWGIDKDPVAAKQVCSRFHLRGWLAGWPLGLAD